MRCIHEVVPGSYPAFTNSLFWLHPQTSFSSLTVCWSVEEMDGNVTRTEQGAWEELNLKKSLGLLDSPKPVFALLLYLLMCFFFT